MLAIWREHSDDRLHDPQDVVALGAGHVLAVLPSSRPPIVGPGQTRATQHHAEAVDEGFRVLRTAVLSDLSDESSVVSVSATSSDVDATGVAAGLADAVHRSGRTVVLVLADIRGAAPQPPGPGLFDLIRDLPGLAADQVADALSEVAPGLLVLGPGSASIESDDLVSSDVTGTLLKELRSRAELVVVAAPPAATAAGQALAIASDAAILVTRFEHSTHKDLLFSHDAMSYRHARVLGVAAIARQRRSTTAHRTPL
jgi:polysaccharide biosynthesis transport protein